MAAAVERCDEWPCERDRWLNRADHLFCRRRGLVRMSWDTPGEARQAMGTALTAGPGLLRVACLLNNRSVPKGMWEQLPHGTLRQSSSTGRTPRARPAERD